MNKDSKICIVGAGAAGITAAECLKDKGYTNVTLLERENYAGGKCKSIEYKGKIYELGAGAIASCHEPVISIAKKYGVELEKIKMNGESIYLDMDSGTNNPPKIGINDFFSFAVELIRYWWIQRKYRKFVKPGHNGVPEELFIPFSEWAKKNKVTNLVERFAPFTVGFGYGYFDQVPAIYNLKYSSWGLVECFNLGRLFTIPKGIQAIWTETAKHHDVIYDCSINSIKRDSSVVVDTSKGKMTFDALIIASPLDETVNFMDVSSAEKDLFSKIKHVDYRNYSLVLENGPEQLGYIPKNFASNRLGHPVFWYYRHEGSDLYNFYSMCDPEMSDDDAIKNIELVVDKLGAKISEVHRIDKWRYFPHVGEQEMKDGFYEKLESLQGENCTYYVGEIMNFSTVGLSAAYSEDLVDRFF